MTGSMAAKRFICYGFTMITKPQLPAGLTPLLDFGRAARQDVTLGGFLIEQQSLGGARIKALDIAESRLSHVGFEQAMLEKMRLLDCVLSRCDFTAAQLPEASWQRATVLDSRATGLQLQQSSLQDCSFQNSKLDLANFRFAKLKNVAFADCDLSEADFYQATLANVTFKNCVLAKTQFSGAKLVHADFRQSDIGAILGIESFGGAIIDTAQLMHIAPLLAASFKIIVEDN